MTRPVAVFRSGVIGDSGHTVRLDKNGHLVLFPSFQPVHITSWAISATQISRICLRPGMTFWPRLSYRADRRAGSGGRGGGGGGIDAWPNRTPARLFWLTGGLGLWAVSSWCQSS
jgi:hypothetical protein